MSFKLCLSVFLLLSILGEIVPEDDDQLFLERLTRILEEDQGGFRYTGESLQDDLNVDGSGESIDDEQDSYLSRIASSLIAKTTSTTMETTTSYSSSQKSTCPCEKGDRGEKGEAGVCPADCSSKMNLWQKECIGPKINLQRLAQSIQQLIQETKALAYRTVQETSCTCPSFPSAAAAIPDENLYIQLKGNKGDPGASCQNNIRIFQSLQQAIDASANYPDHTYVHIVDQYGRLERVFIRVHGSFFPLTLEGEIQLKPRAPTRPTIITTTTTTTTTTTEAISATLAIPQPKCSVTLPCPKLHLFALGPYVRKMCQFGPCAKLSDYDQLCGRVAEQHHLSGFYRAFMSTSNQWLVNLFADVCISAKIVNIRDQLLFDKFEEIFQGKTPINHILDIQGLQPKFQYWWHGTMNNGTATTDTCFDWTRHDARLSGVASRYPKITQSLFYPQYTWPCSIGDSNMGIFCIETNCDKRMYYKY